VDTFPRDGQLSRRTALAERANELPFLLEPLGTFKEAIPHGAIIDGWELENVAGPDQINGLPVRARKRLQLMADLGLKPKAIVIYHEHQARAESQLRANVATWTTQNLPHYLEELWTFVKRHAPGVGQVTMMMAIGCLVVAGYILGFLVVALVAALGSADPVCVWVDQDDVWWEVDRWYS
jgi:hypothetical protein